MEFTAEDGKFQKKQKDSGYFFSGTKPIIIWTLPSRPIQPASQFPFHLYPFHSLIYVPTTSSRHHLWSICLWIIRLREKRGERAISNENVIDVVNEADEPIFANRTLILKTHWKGRQFSWTAFNRFSWANIQLITDCSVVGMIFYCWMSVERQRTNHADAHGNDDILKILNNTFMK